MTPGIDHSGRRPAKAKIPNPGDVVIPDEHPAGFPRWKVIEIPAAAGPSDAVTLQTTDPTAPVHFIRRRISTLRTVKP